MAQPGSDPDEDQLVCSVCLDVLREPTTLPCGHNYCLACIRGSWDREEALGASSCPQCRQSFRPRPVLVKNHLLARLVEELRPDADADADADADTDADAAPDRAGPEDVACDFCPGGQLKAVRSCLTCLASYCRRHLQPHRRVASFKTHRLAAPCRRLQDSLCPLHGEALRLFCRTDRRCICFLCSVDGHRGHDTATAAAERAARQRRLEDEAADAQRGVRAREEDAELLRRELEALRHAADAALGAADRVSLELRRLVQTRLDEAKRRIGVQRDGEESRVRDLQGKLRREIAALTERRAELTALSRTEDDVQFLLRCPSPSPSPPPSPPPSPSPPGEAAEPPGVVRYEQHLAAAVAEVRERLQAVLSRGGGVSEAAARADGLPAALRPEPRTRGDFLKLWRSVTLDPNTVNSYMLLSRDNRRAQVVDKPLTRVHHGERFWECCQVLSAEGLTERSYWEVQWAGEGVCVALAYGDVGRAGRGNDCKFGHNDRSWALQCHHRCFWHDNKQTVLTGPRSSRVGVYLDPPAGRLSFYDVSDVSDVMTLLHSVRAAFTRPLHVGLRLYYTFVDSAELCDP